MKRSLITFAWVLAAIYVIFSLLDSKGEYAVEQKLFAANQKFTQITKDPQSVPDQAYADLAKQYQKIIDEHSGSVLAPKAQVLLGRLYLVKKDYAVAREKFAEVFKKYPDKMELCAEAASGIGKTYESAGDWPNALKSYQELINKYTTTEIGMNAPVYIANHYAKNNMQTQAQASFNDALLHYQALESAHAGTPIELRSLKMQADCYLFQKRWAEAIDTFGKLLSRSAKQKRLTPQQATTLIKTINTLSGTQLKDYGAPVRIYKQFIAENPQHGLNAILEKTIKVFEAMKSKALEVPDKSEK